MAANYANLSPSELTELLAIRKRRVELRELQAVEAEKEQRVTRTLARIADQNDARALLAKVAPRVPRAQEGLSREQIEHVAADPLLQYCLFQSGKGGMSPGQRRIHVAQGVNRLVRAGNQMGKTRAVCSEMWWQAIGWHPFRVISQRHKSSYFVIKDFDTAYAEFCAKVHEVEPAGILHPKCTYTLGSGYIYLEKGTSHKWIVTKDNYRVTFKSGNQDYNALESGTIDAIFFDEAPKRGHWRAGRQRTSTGGPTLVGFTVQEAPLEWLRLEIDGNPKTGALPLERWETIILKPDIEDAPHRTIEEIQGQIAKAKAGGQYEQRIMGGWEGTTDDRYFLAFNDRICQYTAAELIARFQIAQYRVGADWGEGPKKTGVYLEGIINLPKEPNQPQKYAYVVLAEYISNDATTPTMDAVGFNEALKAINFNPLLIRMGRGDINSMGKGGPGQSVNSAFEAAFAKEIGARVCPFKMVVPDKSKGSVDLGFAQISHAQMEERYFVASECESLIQSFNHFRKDGSAKDEGYKHALDAVRYGIDDTFEQDKTPVIPNRAHSRRPSDMPSRID